MGFLPFLLEFNFSLTAAGGLPDVAANSSGIGAGPLAPGRQVARMADAAGNLKILQTIYVLANDLAKFSFDAESFFYKVLKFVLFVLGQILCQLFRIDLSLRKNLGARSQSDTINVGKGILDLFLIRNVYTE